MVAKIEVSPEEEMANPQGVKVFAFEIHGLPEEFVHFRTLCVECNVATRICSKSCVRVWSATGAGTGGDSVF